MNRAASIADRELSAVEQESRTSERPSRFETRGQLLFWLLIMSLASYLITSRYVVAAVVVQGRSMVPTLRDGDRYLLSRCTYWFRQPRRGDLVVVRDVGHHDLAVKRIIALPGERMELKEGVVFVDGKRLDEPYLPSGMKTYAPSWKDLDIQLGSGCYFLLGDNRPSSEDSRTYGPLERGRILGLLVR